MTSKSHVYNYDELVRKTDHKQLINSHDLIKSLSCSKGIRESDIQVVLLGQYSLAKTQGKWEWVRKVQRDAQFLLSDTWIRENMPHVIASANLPYHRPKTNPMNDQVVSGIMCKDARLQTQNLPTLTAILSSESGSLHDNVGPKSVVQGIPGYSEEEEGTSGLYIQKTQSRPTLTEDETVIVSSPGELFSKGLLDSLPPSTTDYPEAGSDVVIDVTVTSGSRARKRRARHSHKPGKSQGKKLFTVQGSDSASASAMPTSEQEGRVRVQGARKYFATPTQDQASSTKPMLGTKRANKICTSSCPLIPCKCKVKNMGKHIRASHLPVTFQSKEISDTNHLCRVRALQFLARRILGCNRGIDGLVGHVNGLHTSPVAGSSIPEDQQQQMSNMCRVLGWEIPDKFTLSPLNSPAVLIHWKPLMILLGLVSPSARKRFRRLGQERKSGNRRLLAPSGASIPVSTPLAATQESAEDTGDNNMGGGSVFVPLTITITNDSADKVVGEATQTLGADDHAPVTSKVGAPLPGLPVAFDSHFHLDRTIQNLPGFSKKATLDQILQYRQNPTPKHGVYLDRMVAVYCDPETYPTTLPEDKRLIFSVGVHPRKHSKLTEERRQQFERLATDPRVTAIGECGLDRTDPPNSWPSQEQTLRSALQFVTPNKPLVLHFRDNKRKHGSSVLEDGFSVVKEYCGPRQPIHLHCFTGVLRDVQEWSWAYPDCYFGFTGLVAHFNTEQKQALRAISKERLLLETDAPHLAPVRGICNTPAYLGDVAAIMASLLAGTKWKKLEIARFYEKRDAVVDEFDEGVLELEISNLGHETPSEFSDSDEYDSTSDEYESSSDEYDPMSDESESSSDDSESLSDESEPDSDCETPNIISLKMTPEPLMYSDDPVNQKLFDELSEQALGQMLNRLSLPDLPQFEEYKFMNGKTKQFDGDNKGITNSARVHTIKNKQSLREIKTSAEISQTREVAASLTPELGGGEQLQTFSNKCTHSIGRTDADARPVKVNDQQTDTANKDSKLASSLKTEQASGKTKRRFLEKMTQGLRQRQAIPSKAKTNAVTRMSIRENVSDVGTATETPIPCNANADGSVVEVGEKDVMKQKKACKKQGFFRRISAIFSRKRSPPSPKSIIHVQPATLNTDYMPP